MIDFRRLNIAKIADILEEKIRDSPGADRHKPRIGANEEDLEFLKARFQLPGAALRTISEKEDGWPCRLFLDILGDELEAASSLRLDLQFGRVSSNPQVFEVHDFFRWSGSELILLSRQISALGKLIDEGLQATIGPEGSPGDTTRICSVTKKIAGIYHWAAEWGCQFQSVVTGEGEEFDRLLQLHSRSALILMDGIEDLYNKVRSVFEYWRTLSQEEKEVHRAQVVVTLPSLDVEEINKELDKIRRLHGL